MASVNNEDGPHFAELLRVLDESAAWAARIGPGAERLRPAPRSPLRGDDDRAHPYELSHAAWHSLSMPWTISAACARCCATRR